jgi:hypothetical protein
MVFIVLIPGMTEGLFYYQEVQELVLGADSTKFGGVYFSQTRCMKGAGVGC